MDDEMTVADVLRKAAGVVRDRGWCRWITQDGAGRVCAYGAINTALHGHGNWDVDEDRAIDVGAVPALVLGIRRTALAVWNNEVAEDGEQVAQVFEKAAARWEEGL